MSGGADGYAEAQRRFGEPQQPTLDPITTAIYDAEADARDAEIAERDILRLMRDETMQRAMRQVRHQ
jgi:hypothetical protein